MISFFFYLNDKSWFYKDPAIYYDLTIKTVSSLTFKLLGVFGILKRGDNTKKSPIAQGFFLFVLP